LGIAPTGPLFNVCEAWISKNGFDAELTRAMQEWQKRFLAGQMVRCASMWLADDGVRHGSSD
jgi:hypothetical protein